MQKAAFSQAVRPAGRVSRARSSTMVVRAAAADSEARRVMSGVLAGVAALSATALPAAAIDLFDDRKAIEKGFDIIYEARDLSLPQATRDGFTQARESIEATKKRVAESEKRIDAELEPFISKAYWLEARQQLRRQTGTLSFDLNVLASNLPKAEKKAALAAKADFFKAVNALDNALVKKDKSTALSKLPAVQTSLDAVLKAVKA